MEVHLGADPERNREEREENQKEAEVGEGTGAPILLVKQKLGDSQTCGHRKSNKNQLRIKQEKQLNDVHNDQR